MALRLRPRFNEGNDHLYHLRRHRPRDFTREALFGARLSIQPMDAPTPRECPVCPDSLDIAGVITPNEGNEGGNK